MLASVRYSISKHSYEINFGCFSDEYKGRQPHFPSHGDSVIILVSWESSSMEMDFKEACLVFQDTEFHSIGNSLRTWETSNLTQSDFT